jgi:glucosylceramidase
VRQISFIFAVLNLSLSAYLYGQTVSVYVTSQAGDRITPKPPIHFSQSSADSDRSLAEIQIDDINRDQKIDGFGASFLEAGAVCLRMLDPAVQERVLRALFDPEQGAGFSAMKTVIGATDFMSAGPYYTYDDYPGDIKLLHFSIERDLQPTGLIPYIKRAQKYGSFVLQAPMDYPPDWMLFDIGKHQEVEPRYFPVLAQYYVRYLSEYKKNGITIDYLSPFNEPGIYTKISADKIRDFLKDNLGPLLSAQNLSTKIQVGDFGNRFDAERFLRVILRDRTASKYVRSISYHGYEFKDYAKITTLHHQYPTIPIWMTEVDHSYGTDTPRSQVLPRYDFEDGDFWGNQIISDLESGASAWIYWNMILDETGGPYLLSEIHRDDADNYQHPVVIINQKTKQITYTALYYYLAHFSKFVRPGAFRIRCRDAIPKVRCAAFKSPQGAITTEIVNSRRQSITVRLRWGNKALKPRLPSLSITSLVWAADN